MCKYSEYRRKIVKFDCLIHNTSIKSGVIGGEIADFEI